MATLTESNPEIINFVKQVESDYRVNVVHVYKDHPSFNDKYMIVVLLPNSYVVNFTANKLTEAQRYINDNIEDWYKTSRKPLKESK